MFAALAACGQDAAMSLAMRVLGPRSVTFVFEKIEAPVDQFTIQQRDKSILIRGNNDISMAAGLGHYLRHCAKVYISWDLDDPVQLPASFPAVQGVITATAHESQRHCLSPDDFATTFAWWWWPHWERLIDWMALNGINRPLALTGNEAVWRDVWRSLKIETDSVRGFGIYGQLKADIRSDRWIEGQRKLQSWILERERELGMTPVLPAFDGVAPDGFAKVHPGAHIQSGRLNPDDPQFSVVQKRWIETLDRLYTTSHLYYADIHTQAGAQARAAYNSIIATDPSAVWVMPLSGNTATLLASLPAKGVNAYDCAAYQCTPTGGNTALREYAFEKAWLAGTTLDQWAMDWCDSRLGHSDPNARQMWMLLVDSVLQGGLSPCATGNLGTSWLGLAMCADSKRDSYNYDLADMASQWLLLCFNEVRAKFDIAAEHTDTASLRHLQQTGRLILNDIDRLLASHSRFLAGQQIEKARSWGMTKEERMHYEYNASQMLADECIKRTEAPAPDGRLMSGVVKGLHIPLWQQYTDGAIHAAEKGRHFDTSEYRRDAGGISIQWATTRKNLSTLPTDNTKTILTSIVSQSFPVYFHDADLLSAYMELFPRSQLVDLYKYCFQDFFGPMHLSQNGERPDSAACAGAIQKELALLSPSDTNPDYHYTAPLGQYVRVNLRLVRDGVLPLPELTSALLASMTPSRANDIEIWKSRWGQLLTDIPHVIIRPSNFAADSSEIANNLQEGIYTAHHSQQFNHAYNYHYRIIRADLFEQRLLPIINNRNKRQ